MNKQASTEYPIHSLIQHRWSPYRFMNREVTKLELMSLFEAARWAPSSYNEQPWRFILATKDKPDEFAKMQSILLQANQSWAKDAWALVLAATHLVFARNGKQNKAAIHDLGAAVSYLSLEAAARGISVHQIIGIDHDQARTVFNVPGEYEVLTAFAIGYADMNAQGDNKYTQRDNTVRSRNKVSEFVYENSWANHLS